MEVLVSASTGALGVILPKLAEMLTDEYKLRKGTKEGIRFIKSELEIMQTALEKLSEVPPDQLDKQVKLWAKKVREMSYRIEDTIDSFMVLRDAGVESGSSTTCCASIKSMLPRLYKAQGDIAAEIECIKREVEDMSKRRDRYKIDSIVAPAPPDPRLRALYEDEAKLVGIDHSREEIITLLSTSMEGEGASEQKLKLVSIVGPGGMGKTTLANAVYQKLEKKFKCSAFVSVSLQPDVKNILSSILRQLTDKIKDNPEDKDMSNDKSLPRQESQKHYGNTETWSEKEIIDKIRHVLEKRRYLILIDDIWDEQPWKVIECVLFENKLGSKVIMTTRNIDVAKSCCSSDKVDGIIHELQPLSYGDSKQLLYDKIFGKDGRCPTELQAVAKKILEKCEGWPLALVTIASLLANQPAQTKVQWDSVYRSISTGLEDNRGVKDMRSILSLSYCDMPSLLRPCLLYLSIFPEDSIIRRDDLIRRWIAEDLVHGRQNVSLYELGDKYFHELINRSMIQPSDVDAFGRAQACKVHDLVLEFITFLSAEEDFVTILNGQQRFPPEPDNIHRLSLRNKKGEHGIPQGTKRLPHVRTLIVSSRAIGSMPSLSIFPVLRVLELELASNSHSVKGVENLVHLRYLRLIQEYLYYEYDVVCITLPKGIGSLQFLQTLDLKEAMIQELPSSLVELTQLRVLEISVLKWDKRCEKHMLQFLCNARQLEELCIFVPYKPFHHSWKNIVSLDFMLKIDWAPRKLWRFTASPRAGTEHRIRRGSIWEESSPFSILPGWINSSLSSLSDLSIMVRTLRQEDLEILADIPILRSFDLEVVEAAGSSRLEMNGSVDGTGHATSFRCLRNLKFVSRAAGLVFRPGALQELRKLYLCFEVAATKDVYGDFDLGLENLKMLKTVSVDINCACARSWEVEAVEAALRNATNLNPNSPTLVVQRDFADTLLYDEEEEIPEDLQAKKKEDALLSRFGPFGGHRGRACDIRVSPHRLESVTIRYANIVGSLAFSYTDQNGHQRSAGPWGGHYEESVNVWTINLGTSEHLIQVSGTNGSHPAAPDLITSLTFVTNAASYGPFGEPRGDLFVLEVQNNSSIVGFFCRAGWYLDAIGFYVRPL